MQKLEMPNSPRFLKVVELAELLKIKRTIYEMVAQNRIPYRKPPGSNILRFDLEEILEWTRRKTDDLRDRCCYHPPRSLVAATLKENTMSVYKRGKKGT